MPSSQDEERNAAESHAAGASSNTWPSREEYPKAWGVFLFALIGATATTAAVTHLRRTFDWFCTQLNRSQPFSSLKNASSRSSYGYGYGSFREEAWKRYRRRLQEEYEEEMERVERIRRMQNVFNRERNKYKRGYESWREHGPGAYQHYQHVQRDDWYWQSDASYRGQRGNSQETSRDGGNYALSHHYSILGLERWRTKPYTDAEIKKAFRAKAMEYHPDQNQKNKDVAEAKFKEVMTSYEAIKTERKNGTL